MTVAPFRKREGLTPTSSSDTGDSGYDFLVQEYKLYMVGTEYDALRLFTGTAFFTRMTRNAMIHSRMILLPVPVSRRDKEIVKAVYRRSAYREGETVGFEEYLLKAGCFFRIDSENGWIYYSNSKAVFLGLPPTAESLGWPKLQLEDFPQGDYYQVLEDGYLTVPRNESGRGAARPSAAAATPANSGTN
jgi:hypothetical protein